MVHRLKSTIYTQKETVSIVKAKESRVKDWLGEMTTR